MGASKEYYLKLQEEQFHELSQEEQSYLIRKGMEVRQKPIEQDEVDEHYKSLRKERLKAWNEEQDYLYKKRNKML